jgi:hypothetical protein
MVCSDNDICSFVNKVVVAMNVCALSAIYCTKEFPFTDILTELSVTSVKANAVSRACCNCRHMLYMSK